MSTANGSWELRVVLRIWIHVALQTRHLCRTFAQVSTVCTFQESWNTYTCTLTTSSSDIIITCLLMCEKEGFRQFPTLWGKRKKEKITHSSLLCAFTIPRHQCSVSLQCVFYRMIIVRHVYNTFVLITEPERGSCYFGPGNDFSVTSCGKRWPQIGPCLH